MRNIEYYVNEDAKVVAGVMSLRSLYSDLENAMPASMIDIIFSAMDCIKNGAEIESMNGYGKIRAKAKCSGNDNYRLDTGKKICESKLYMKEHERFAKHYRRVAKILEKTIRHITKLAEQHERKAAFIKADIEKEYMGKAIE